MKARFLHHAGHRPAVAPRAGAVQGRALGAGRASRGRAPRRRRDGHPRRTRPRRPDQSRVCRWCTPSRWEHALDRATISSAARATPCARVLRAAPGGVRPRSRSARPRATIARRGPRRRRHPRPEHAFSRDGGLAVLYGNLAEDGCIVKTAGVDPAFLKFAGPARIFESQDAAVEASSTGDRCRRCRPDPLRGPARRPRHAGDALSHQLSQVEGPRQSLRARSPTAASPAAARASASATSRPRRPRAARSPWSKRATPSRSTSPNASCASSSPPASWPPAARR
jgi:hypothetical protein